MRRTIILITLLTAALIAGCTSGGGTKASEAQTASETAVKKKVCRRIEPNATSRIGRRVCR